MPPHLYVLGVGAHHEGVRPFGPHLPQAEVQAIGVGPPQGHPLGPDHGTEHLPKTELPQDLVDMLFVGVGHDPKSAAYPVEHRYTAARIGVDGRAGDDVPVVRGHEHGHEVPVHARAAAVVFAEEPTINVSKV